MLLYFQSKRLNIWFSLQEELRTTGSTQNLSIKNVTYAIFHRHSSTVADVDVLGPFSISYSEAQVTCDVLSKSHDRSQFWPSGIVIGCVCVSVCVCVNHELVCTITHRSFKLGSPNLDQRCKAPWFRSLLFFWDDRPWPSRSNLTLNSNFTSFWACTHHNSPALQARITKFGPKMDLSTFIFNLETYFSTKFICALFVLYLVRPIACKY